MTGLKIFDRKKKKRKKVLKRRVLQQPHASTSEFKRKHLISGATYRNKFFAQIRYPVGKYEINEQKHLRQNSIENGSQSKTHFSTFNKMFFTHQPIAATVCVFSQLEHVTLLAINIPSHIPNMLWDTEHPGQTTLQCYWNFHDQCKCIHQSENLVLLRLARLAFNIRVRTKHCFWMPDGKSLYTPKPKFAGFAKRVRVHKYG